MTRDLFPLLALLAGAVLGYRLRDTEEPRDLAPAWSRAVARVERRVEAGARDCRAACDATRAELREHRDEAADMAQTCAVPGMWMDLGVLPLPRMAPTPE